MKVKVCVIQDNPVFFDKEKTLDKVEEITRKYASQGCELIVFPETFIPGYPRGFDFGTKIGSRTHEGRELFKEYYKNSIDIKDNEIKRLEKLAKSEKVYLVTGITERIGGSLYCSMAYFSPLAGLMGVHRKIKPTGTERVVWAEGSGKSLVTFNTRIGVMGGLICWENYMPLARMAIYEKAVDIYIAPTADSRDTWTSTMRHIALEGRCFVLGCNQYFTKEMYPPKYQKHLNTDSNPLCPGGSLIVSPLGELIAGPLYNRTGALIADLDLTEIASSKLDFDVTGHYSRDDIFQLTIKDQPETLKD